MLHSIGFGMILAQGRDGKKVLMGTIYIYISTHELG